MNYSLIQIIKKLKDFSEAHLQVKSFTMKDPLELLNCSESLFPAILANLQPIRVSGNIITVGFDLYFSDLINKNLDNEFFVISDQTLIALDLRAYLNDPAFDDLFTVVESSAITPFYEKGDNELTGVMMSLQLNIYDNKDRCQIPV